MGKGQAGLLQASLTTSCDATNKQTNSYAPAIVQLKKLQNSPSPTVVVLQLLLLKNHFRCIMNKHADPQAPATEVLMRQVSG